jgi:hypothetical protein
MRMTLAADGLTSEPPFIIGDDPEQKHAAAKIHRIRMTAYIHRNAVNRVGTRAIAITKAGADGVEPAVLWKRPESALSVLESSRAIVPANDETRIKRQGTFSHPPEVR